MAPALVLVILALPWLAHAQPGGDPVPAPPPGTSPPPPSNPQPGYPPPGYPPPGYPPPGYPPPGYPPPGYAQPAHGYAYPPPPPPAGVRSQGTLSHHGWFRLGALVPVGNGYAGSKETGVAFDVSYWIEARWFAIELRTGLHGDALRDPITFGEVPLDVGGYGVFGSGGLAGFIGGGVGPRFIWATLYNKTQSGVVIPTKMTEDETRSGWCFGVYGRAGLMIGRHHAARFTVQAEISAAFLELFGRSTPLAFTAGVGLMR